MKFLLKWMGLLVDRLDRLQTLFLQKFWVSNLSELSTLKGIDPCKDKLAVGKRWFVFVKSINDCYYFKSKAFLNIAQNKPMLFDYLNYKNYNQ